MEVSVVDVRSLEPISGLSTIKADARHLAQVPAGSVDSISCLHALEHFGLGRYGDEIDPRAWETALSEMVRILAPGGIMYLSVPIGTERLEFTASECSL